MTKDERFLLELYRKLRGDVDGTCDPRRIAQELNYNERLMNNILRGLMQANFVKRYSSDEIGLTERGCEVAESLSA